MSSATKHDTPIEADAHLPTVRIVLEVDAPVDRAHVGPRAGQEVARAAVDRRRDQDVGHADGRGVPLHRAPRRKEVAYSYGSVHRLWENQRIVQTSGFEGKPEAVSLDTTEFIDLCDGRTRLEVLPVVHTSEARDGVLDSGMEVGVEAGYDGLDGLLSKEAWA